jgi:hypothetical protein
VLVIAGLLVFLVLPGIVIDPSEFSAAKDRVAAENAVRTVGVQLLGGFVLTVGAYFTARTYRLNREGRSRTDSVRQSVTSPARNWLRNSGACTRWNGSCGIQPVTKDRFWRSSARSSALEHATNVPTISFPRLRWPQPYA